MTPRSARAAPAVLRGTARRDREGGMRVLLAAAPMGAALPAAAAARALTRGLELAGLAAPDVLEVPGDRSQEELRALLEDEDFDARLHVARALLVTAAHLGERTLAGSPTFEVATRARQAGVPAYALTAEDALGAFDARILDLQLVLAARSRPALTAAGRRLGLLLLADDRA